MKKKKTFDLYDRALLYMYIVRPSPVPLLSFFGRWRRRSSERGFHAPTRFRKPENGKRNPFVSASRDCARD